MHKIFDEFASLWMRMKGYAKSKSDYDAQQFKFKPRAFQIESVIQVEMPVLANPSEAFSEWKEFYDGEKSDEKVRLVFNAKCLFIIDAILCISDLK